MLSRLDLLSRGYFPHELPSPFQTRVFASAVDSNWNSLPAAFTDGTAFARMTTHNLARAGTLRRRLGIPNPVPFVALCQVIADHWPELDVHTQASPISKSHPVLGRGSGRSLVPHLALGELVPLRAKERANSRFILKADVSLFYHSIYSHSIPWAIHTKPYAKANQQEPILGNLLDKHVRNCQDRQTIGIPVGPDTSLVIAEAVLSAVDQKLASCMGELRGFRYMDDYELGFSALSDAEAGLGLLQEVLSEYELELNPRKTAIVERPSDMETAWVLRLKRFRIRQQEQAQATDILAYFDMAFAFARKQPEAPIFRYAIARLRGVDIDSANWDLFQHLLIQCLAIEPGAIVPILEQIIHYHQAEYTVDLATLGNVLNSQIAHHARLGHGSEVAWSLWTMIAFGLQVGTSAAQAVSRMSDSVVALLALDANDRGLVSSELDLSNWGSYMDQAGLREEQWLLSYEANVKGWLPSLDGGDHVSSDSSFGFLKSLDVEFYDRARTSATMVSTGTAPSTGAAPLFVLPATAYE